jgi:Domain of unknown function (DUF222)
MVAVLRDDPVVDLGQWLIDERRGSDQGEGAWLAGLADFDREAGWAADGQLSCADWLGWRCGMARATAYDKLRVAHELGRRPRVAEAFAAGTISYSAVRAIIRLEGVSDAVDEALVALAATGTVLALEQAVRHYRLNDEQDRAVDPFWRRHDRRGVRLHRGLTGMGAAEITLTDVELEELATAVQAFIDLTIPPTPPVTSREDSSTGSDDTPWRAKRADAFMDMVRTAVAHAHDGAAAGADRYMVHVVTDVNGGALIDGTPLDAETVARLACDASTVTHLVAGGEPLRLGRKTREWSAAQRRAITVRDGGRCRFPGCHRTIGDIHHLRWWDKGGATDIDNGLFICNRHHTLVHKGFKAAGNTNRQVTFTRPDGTVLGTTGRRT